MLDNMLKSINSVRFPDDRMTLTGSAGWLLMVPVSGQVDYRCFWAPHGVWTPHRWKPARSPITSSSAAPPSSRSRCGQPERRLVAGDILLVPHGGVSLWTARR